MRTQPTREITRSTVVGSLGHIGVRLGSLPAGLSKPVGLAFGSGGELFIADDVANAILVARF